MILKCSCYHAGQDKIHGKQNRVFNKTQKSDGKLFRCTVCGSEKNINNTFKK